MTSLSTASGKFDGLVNNMRELKREKARLLDKLNEIQRQKNAEEKSLELARRRCHHGKEKHNMMTETLRVAKHKVAQAQEQMDSLENVIHKKRQNISSLTEAIQVQEQQHLENIHGFEEKLNQLAEMFLGARTFFTEEGLQREVQKTKENYSENIESIQTLNSTIENLSKGLQQLQLQNEALFDRKDGFIHDFPKELQKDIIKLFKDEESQACEEMKELQNNLNTLFAKLGEGQGTENSVA